MRRSVRDIQGGQENNKLEPPGGAEDDMRSRGEIVQAGDQWNEINKAVQEAHIHARVCECVCACMGCRLAAGGSRQQGREGAESSGGPPGDAGRPRLIHYE